MKKAVIFDLDGTTLYTLEDLNDALNFCLSYYGYNKVTIEDTRKFIGDGIRMLIIRAAKDESKADLMFAKFKEYYKENCNNHTIPYDGIVDLLHYLKEKNIKVGIVSNKAIYALKILVEAHFNGLVDSVIGDQMGYKRKPDPEALLACCKELNVFVDEIYYVGDSDTDAKTIINTKCDGVLVDYGFRSRNELEKFGIEPIVSTAKELLDFFKGVF